MNKTIWIIMFMLISTSVLADMKLKDYEKLSKQEKEIVNFYLHGVGVGSGWIQAIGANQNRNQYVYCQNEKLSLTMENYIDILNKRITEVKRNPEVYSITYVELELINGLIDTFPCK